MFEFVRWLLIASNQLGVTITPRDEGCIITDALNFSHDKEDAEELIKIVKAGADKCKVSVCLTHDEQEGIYLEFSNES